MMVRSKISVLLTGLVGTVVVFCCLGLFGCSGYSNSSLYDEGINTVYVEMFNNESFRRGLEYDLSAALSKRIELETPYKVVSDRQRADSVLSGKITSLGETVLSVERQTGRALSKGAEVSAVVSWKNMNTGELLMDQEMARGLADFSEWQNQGFEYGSKLAANKLADRIVELMEIDW